MNSCIMDLDLEFEIRIRLATSIIDQTWYKKGGEKQGVFLLNRARAFVLLPGHTTHDHPPQFISLSSLSSSATHHTHDQGGSKTLDFPLT